MCETANFCPKDSIQSEESVLEDKWFTVPHYTTYEINSKGQIRRQLPSGRFKLVKIHNRGNKDFILIDNNRVYISHLVESIGFIELNSAPEKSTKHNESAPEDDYDPINWQFLEQLNGANYSLDTILAFNYLIKTKLVTTTEASLAITEIYSE